MEKPQITFKDLFVGAAKTPFVEFFRSLFVGAAAFIVDFALMILLVERVGLSAVAAGLFSFIAGLIVNYILSVRWAFKQSNIKSGMVRFLIFAATGAIGLLMNEGIIWLFEFPLAESAALGNALSPQYYYVVGKLVSTVVVFFWNFFSKKLLLFRSENPKA